MTTETIETKLNLTKWLLATLALALLGLTGSVLIHLQQSKVDKDVYTVHQEHTMEKLDKIDKTQQEINKTLYKIQLKLASE